MPRDLKQQCSYCGHSVENHTHDNRLKNCKACNECPTFQAPDRMAYLRFCRLLEWTRKWLKHNKKRSIKRFRQGWSYLGDVGYLGSCKKCKSAVIINNETSRRFFKRQDSLSCQNCRSCEKCCKCIECSRCHNYRTSDRFCHNIIDAAQHCENCCKCRYCGQCRVQCTGDWCENCGNCFGKHCECAYIASVPWYSTKPHFHKAARNEYKQNPLQRYIASEIEVGQITGNGRKIYDVVKKWGGSIVRDASLPQNGFEINTAPSSGDVFIQQINEVCAAITNEGGIIHPQKCGLHIHVDARDFNYYDIRRLIRVYAKIEPILFQLVPEDRSFSRFCKPCGERFIQSIEGGKLPYDKVKADVIKCVYNSYNTKKRRTKKYDKSRYVALNLHSWFYRKTIENRMFNGTLDPNEIINWGIFWARLCEYVLHISDEQLTEELEATPAIVLKMMISSHPSIMSFVSKRIKQYGLGQDIINELSN